MIEYVGLHPICPYCGRINLNYPQSTVEDIIEHYNGSIQICQYCNCKYVFFIRYSIRYRTVPLFDDLEEEHNA